jgi:hypothetical protein
MQFVVSIPAAIIGAVLVFVGSGIKGGAILTTVGLLLIIGALVFSYIYWRCPACNRYLGKGMIPDTCRFCGAKFK